MIKGQIIVIVTGSVINLDEYPIDMTILERHNATNIYLTGIALVGDACESFG